MDKNIINNYKIEIDRLNSKQTAYSDVHKLGVLRIKVQVKESRCLENIKRLLRTIDEQIIVTHGSPTIEDWLKSLPSDFIEKFAKEMTQEEANDWLKKWQSLSMQERIQEEKKRQWSFSNWIYWFEPENRKWFIYNQTEINEHDFWLDVIMMEIPTPIEALRVMINLLNGNIYEELEL